MTGVIPGRLLVVGGSSGMGEAVVQLASDRYSNVTVLDIQPLKGIDKYKNVDFIETDVTDYEAVRASVGKATDSVAVISCVGRETASVFRDQGPADWQRLIDVNFLSAVHVSHAALEMCNDLQSIVLTASDAGRVGTKGQAVYSGVKAGVIGFAKGLAREIAPELRINVVSPGPTDTPLFREARDKATGLMDKMVRAIPMRRAAEATELASAMLYLVSPDSSFVTGQVLSVSGGLTMVD